MKFKKKIRAGQQTEQEESSSIAWYPGHMARAQRDIDQNLKKVHLVLELRDARLPLGSENPVLAQSIKRKKHLLVLNKVNLIDPAEAQEWQFWFKKKGQSVSLLNSFEAQSLNELKNDIINLAHEGRESGELPKVKVMIVGLPNTGKSTLINHLAARPVTRVQDRPGLTQKQQWVSTHDGRLDIIDTPGIMCPKIENEQQALCLGLINALKEEHLDLEDLSFFLVKKILGHKPSDLQENYQLSLSDSTDPLEVLNAIARRLGHLKKGGEVDYNRTAKALLTDYRHGKFSPFCLERPR